LHSNHIEGQTNTCTPPQPRSRRRRIPRASRNSRKRLDAAAAARASARF